MLFVRLHPSSQTVRVPSRLRDRVPVSTTPRLELNHIDDRLILHLELPGVEGKDVDVEATRHSVKISGKQHLDKRFEGQNILYSEINYGNFEREISLPVAVENDRAIAQFESGILTLILPKVQPDSKRVVKLNLGETAPAAELEDRDPWDSDNTKAA